MLRSKEMRSKEMSELQDSCNHLIKFLTILKNLKLSTINF